MKKQEEGGGGMQNCECWTVRAVKSGTGSSRKFYELLTKGFFIPFTIPLPSSNVVNSD